MEFYSLLRLFEGVFGCSLCFTIIQQTINFLPNNKSARSIATRFVEVFYLIVCYWRLA